MPEGSVRSYLMDKRFMVITKLVDVLVEPLADADGLNLYEDQQGLALAELLRMAGPVLGDAAAYHRMLQAFVDWVRQRVTTDDFFAAITAYKTSIPAEHADFAGWIELLECCRGGRRDRRRPRGRRAARHPRPGGACAVLPLHQLR
ncbi:hypothetical protein ACFQ0G_00030 [Streptomyces chiangmaiensis]